MSTLPARTSAVSPLSAVQSASNLIGWRGWALVLVITIGLRLIVMVSGTVSFHSDEAVVGLMAHHINQGLPIPVFFYGQAYLGSLDALLVALGFRIFGESVLTIRIVQSILYVLIVLSTVYLTRRLSGRAWAAVAAGLLLAVPPVLMTLYTSMTLGGYSETLLLGNAVILIGWELANDFPAAANQRDRRYWLIRRWALLGLIAGLGWWTDALIMGYLLPVTLYLIWRLFIPQWRTVWRFWPWITLAAVCFVIGSAPWWGYNLAHQWDALRFLIDGAAHGNGIELNVFQRAVNLLILGLPTVFGLRFPWAGLPWAGAAAGVVLTVYVGLLILAMARSRPPGDNPRRADSEIRRALRYGLLLISGPPVLFVLSAFGVDVSGRYLLPMVPLLALLTGITAESIGGPRRRHAPGRLLVAGLLIFALLGTITAMTTIPPGITPQFDPANDVPNTSDQALIDFLLAHGGTRGYGTYWVTFRIAFLSQERIILDAWLPNKRSFIYNPVDRRYPPYTALVEAAARRVYVTANLPLLDAIIAERLGAHAVTFQRQAIGPYTVFYDLSAPVTPDDLGLDTLPNPAEVPILPTF